MWPELDMTQEGIGLEQWWNFKSTTEWREKLLATANSNKSLISGCRQCPIFEMY